MSDSGSGKSIILYYMGGGGHLSGTQLDLRKKKKPTGKGRGKRLISRDGRKNRGRGVDPGGGK